MGILFSPVFAEARILNLRGNLTLDYSFSQSDSGQSVSKVESFGQRYNLGMGGKIFRFGQYNLTGAWVNDRIKTESRIQGAPSSKQEIELTIQEYRFFTSLSPTSSPLSLSAQRVIRENKFEDSSSKDIIDLLSATWALNIRRAPRTVLSYTRSRLRSTTSLGGSGDFDNQAFSVQGNGTIQETHISLGYQWTESKSGDSGNAQSQALNFQLRSFLTKALVLTVNGRYSTSEIPPSVVIPGTSIFQSRGAGLALIYRPPHHWWNGRVSYGYSQNPFVKDLNSHSLSGSLNLRPYSKLNAGVSARISRVELGEASLTTEAVSSSANYRPTFGISTSLGAGLTHALSRSSTDTSIITQSYNYSLNYFKVLRRVRVNSGYALGYGRSNTSPGGSQSQNLSNSGNIGVSNTDTRKVQLSGQLTLTDNRNRASSGNSENTTFRANLNASSNYFRNVIRRGDRINLQGSASHSSSNGLKLEGGQQAFNSSAAYAWKRFSGSLAYSLQIFPSESRLDQQRITGAANWSFVPRRSMNVRLNIRDTFNDTRYRNDTNRFEAGAEISYRIGLVSLNLDYRRIVTSTFVDSGTTHTKVDSVNARLSRAF